MNLKQAIKPFVPKPLRAWRQERLGKMQPLSDRLNLYTLELVPCVTIKDFLRTSVRYYGRDFRNRLREAGFEKIEEITAEGQDVVDYGLWRGEKFFVLVKGEFAAAPSPSPSPSKATKRSSTSSSTPSKSPRPPNSSYLPSQ
jgi:hypothetical protein